MRIKRKWKLNKARFARSMMLLAILLTGAWFTVGKITETNEVSNDAYQVWVETGKVPKGVKPPLFVKTLWETVHKMSHNVVVADEKWGYVPLTEERVNWLLIVVAEGRYKEEHRVELQGIAERWKAGNFRQADHDHNLVWKRLNGTVGEATGVNQNNVPEWAR